MNIQNDIPRLMKQIDAARNLKQAYLDDSKRLLGGAIDPNYRSATALLETNKSQLYAMTGIRYAGDAAGYRLQQRKQFQRDWEQGLVLAPSGGNSWDSFLDVSAGVSTGIGQVTSFGTLESMQRGLNYGDDILGYNKSGASYKVGIGIGVGISVATGYSAFATAGTGFAASGALRTGLQAYSIAGDVYGVGQSSYDVLNGQENWSTGLGFLPMVGAGAAGMRGVRSARGLSTFGRNADLLTTSQIDQLRRAAGQVGLGPNDIRFYSGPSIYSDLEDKVWIGPNILPYSRDAQRLGTSALDRFSARAAIAHEAGHLRTTRAGTALEPGSLLDEIQASMVGRTLPGLNKVERFSLLRDAAEKARNSGNSLRDLLPELPAL